MQVFPKALDSPTLFGLSKRHMTQPTAAIDPKLLEILVCPITKGPLRYDEQAGELISNDAGLAYPVRDGIPIMLPEEARKIAAP